MEKSEAISRLKRLPRRLVPLTDFLRLWRLVSIVNELSGSKVLDIGCGVGSLELILNKNKQVVGVDIDSQRIRLARQFNSENTGVRFEKEDFLELEKRQGTDAKLFDIVILGEVLEHLAEPDRVLQAIGRLLSPSGYLVISVPNQNRLKNVLYHSRLKGLDTRMAPDHLREYTAVILTDTLERNGFQVVRFEGAGVRFPGDRVLRFFLPHHGLIRERFTRRYPSLATYFVAVVRKNTAGASETLPAMGSLRPIEEPSRNASFVDLAARITSQRKRSVVHRLMGSLLWRGMSPESAERFCWFYFSPNMGRVTWNGRAACLLLSFDLDHEEDVKAIAGVLEQIKPYGWRTTHACIGMYVSAFPREHELVVQHDCELINHTQNHPPNPMFHGGQPYPQLSKSQLTEEIEQCHDTCKTRLGYTMRGFRAPHFGDQQNDWTHRCLAELGYSFSSSLIATHAPASLPGLPYRQQGVLEIPISPSPLAPPATLETYTLTRSRKRLSKQQYLDGFKTLLRIGIETNSLINLYFDPRDVATCPDVFAEVLKTIAENESRLWIPKYSELFDYWLARHPISESL